MIAILAAIALAAVASMVGRELVSIQSLAVDVQSKVLPQIMARQQRAIWTESLRSAASVVVYAPDQTTRHQALAKAEQLAANVTHADIASRAALDDAWASILLAAGKADEAQRIDQQMRALLSEADHLISDMSANLSSIVDDSGATLARAIKDATSAHDRSPWSMQTLEEVLAINTTSQELLASLDRGRIILSSALSLATDRELNSAEAHFVAIGAQLQARVDTLRGNSDYEYLPAMIERFTRLDAVFGHQRTKIALQREALSASASAKLRLGVVRENLAADAAGAADASIANIAAGASRIKLTVAAMVISLIVVVAVPLTRDWQAVMSSGQIEGQASPMQDAASPSREGTVGATVASLESLIKAQGNLEHWRQTLIAKLSSAVGGALQQAALHGSNAPAGQRSLAPPVQEASHDGDSDHSVTLPVEVTARLTRMVGLIEDVAAQTSRVGLKASLDGVRMIGGVVPDRNHPAVPDERAVSADPACLPSDVLVAVAAAADAVTISVGTTISEINAVATQADRDLAQATADIVHMLAQLADQLTAIRDRDWQRPSTVG